MVDAVNLLEPGAQLDHYRIVRLLGRGGRGQVYIARDTRLGRTIALKVAPPAGPSRVEQFLLEARATAHLNHPNIITIYGAGEHDGRAYLALELVPGTTLRQRMEQGLQQAEALRIGLAITRGLEHAHDQDVLHRDLKPENVMIGADGRVQLVDFGLALLERTSTDDEVRGTPAYMAPEQWGTVSPTTAVDIWSLGIVLHEMVAGQRPQGDPRHPPLSLLPLPATVQQIVVDCLAHNPQMRPTASRVLQMLEHAVHGAVDVGERCPFPGLRAFHEDDAWCFFGREEEVDSLVEQLRHHPTLLLVGPSGSGKTSLVQAGLLARLRAQGHWRILTVRPGQKPLLDLATQLQPLVGTSPDASGAEQLAQLLGHAPAMLGLLLEQAAREVEGTGRGQPNVLLVVDGLDAVGSQLAPFLDAVLDASTDREAPVRTLLVLRDDQLGPVASLAAPEILARARISLVGCPTDQDLIRALVAPLTVIGYRFEDEALAPQMVSEISGRPAGLPLLQFAARSLWDRSHSNWWRAPCSATNAAPSPARTASSAGSSRRLTAARCCWTRWASSRPGRRSRYCACCRTGDFGGWAAWTRWRWTCASSPPPIATWRRCVRRGPSARICCTGSTR